MVSYKGLDIAWQTYLTFVMFRDRTLGREVEVGVQDPAYTGSVPVSEVRFYRMVTKVGLLGWEFEWR